MTFVLETVYILT